MSTSDPSQHVPHRGDKVWQEEQRELSERNAAAQRAGKKQREADDKRTIQRRARADADVPDGRWR